MRRTVGTSSVMLMVLSCFVFWILPKPEAHAQLRIMRVYGHVGAIEIQNFNPSPVNLANYQFATSDLSQPNQTTAMGALGSVTLQPGGRLALGDDAASSFTCFVYGPPCVTIDPDNQGITAPNLGSGPYSMGIYNAGVLEAFIQVKFAALSATGFNSNAVADAVSAGIWPSAASFIEHEGRYAYYQLKSANPIGPGNYQGEVIPEPAVSILLIVALAMTVSTRRFR